MDILNLYAGLGANTYHWDRNQHNITHVEINEEIAEANQELHPQDTVITGDAVEYLEKNYQDFDYIWASPPCPSHSSIRKAGAKNNQYDPKVPDMDLYGVIIFLETYFEGEWTVENVEAYYEPLIKRNLTKTSRHYIWSSHTIPEVDVDTQKIHTRSNSDYLDWLGFDVDHSFETVEKRKVLRNCVHPKIGQKILQARKTKQSALTEVRQNDV